MICFVIHTLITQIMWILRLTWVKSCITKVPDIWVEVSLSTCNPSKWSSIAFKIEAGTKWEFQIWGSNRETEVTLPSWERCSRKIRNREAPHWAAALPGLSLWYAVHPDTCLYCGVEEGFTEPFCDLAAFLLCCEVIFLTPTATQPVGLLCWGIGNTQ